MSSYSNDNHLLHWEPYLFRDVRLASQTLISGSDGAISGTSFSSTSAGFVAAGVAAGCVLTVGDDLAGHLASYEIVAVVDANTLTVSVVRDSDSEPAIAPAAGTALGYRVATFAPQAEEIAFQLDALLGLAPAVPDSDIDTTQILQPRALRSVSVFAVLKTVFVAAASSAAAEGIYWEPTNKN